VLDSLTAAADPTPKVTPPPSDTPAIDEQRLASLSQSTPAPAPAPAATPASPSPAAAKPTPADLGKADDKLSSLLGDDKPRK
jgi:hypothetical protein